MQRLRCAVIGSGYLGRFHAQKYHQLPHVDLVAVCDIDKMACQKLADELQTQAVCSHTELWGKVDAVSIATTTKTHYAIAKACLTQGIHVLLEKPITETLEEAQELIELAHQKNLKLQIGHLERFNPARIAIEPYLQKPQFIDSQRLSPFKPRALDVNVILDLMIHDLDLIQTMVKSPIESIQAQGTPVLSPTIDIANARITFKNRCVANLTASRVSFKSERTMRIVQKNSYISLDLQQKKFVVFEKGQGELYPGIPNFNQKTQVFEQGDALMAEIQAFIECINNNTQPTVTGLEGYHALETAINITTLIERQLEEQLD